MKSPLITWHLKENEIATETFIGNFLSTEVFECEWEVWNNRYGLEEVSTAQSPILILEFKDYEDTKLFEAMKITFNNRQEGRLTVEQNRAYVKLPYSLKGTANTGASNYTDHFVKIKITFTKYLEVKSDLKRLMLDLQY